MTSKLETLRADALSVPSSGIVEVFQHGRLRDGFIPLFVGEGDKPTPDFILQAMMRSFAAGETFYTVQGGLPDLRAAIARYMTRLYQKPFADSEIAFTPERFFVTIGGMQAAQIAIRLLAGAGDEVLVLTPAWPNFKGALCVAGAATREVPLRTEADGSNSFHWTLDFEALEQAVTPATKALVVNSPSNPTGWVASHQDLIGLLNFARAHKLWIIADEIYGRITFDGSRAPSFHDVMNEQDQVLFVQSFSKNWAMTGLRIGWLEVPPELGEAVENLIQYATSGVAVPIQRAAIAALDEGEGFLETQLQRFSESRTVLCDGLSAIKRLSFERPKGAFYLFCKVDGVEDTKALAFRWIDEAGVGVAPGAAFGAAFGSYVRLCFARDPAAMAETVSRLQDWFATSE